MSEYDEEAPVKKKRKLRINKKTVSERTRPKRRKQKPQHALKYVGHYDNKQHESYSEENSSEYPDMDYSIPSMGGFFDKMGSVFSPIGKYVPNFFDYDDDDDKSNANRRPQNSKIKDYLVRQGKTKGSMLR